RPRGAGGGSPASRPVGGWPGSLATTTGLSQPRGLPAPLARAEPAAPAAGASPGGGGGLILLPRGTEMFQFPRCPSRRLYIQRPMRGLAAARVAPFGLDRLIPRLRLPRHVSPLSASFLGTRPLGIPPLPCSAWQVIL